MMPPSNTPPQGDFVRYIERLTAVKVPPQSEPVPTAGSSPAFERFGMLKAGLEPLAQIPFARHVRWVVGLWIAVKVLASFVPGTGFLWLPLLVFYAAWVIFNLRRKAPGAFPGELNTPARRITAPVSRTEKNKSSQP